MLSQLQASASRAVSTLRLAAWFAALASLAIVVQLALLERSPPVRCPAGLNPAEGRCCAGGQRLSGGRCEGPISSCGPLQQLDKLDVVTGCVLRDDVIALAGGVLPAGAADWQLTQSPAALEVAPFGIDRGEVTLARYSECVRAGRCERPLNGVEPGLPITGLPPAEAERFCRTLGGQLPSSAQWRWAASGKEGRRFPWGFTGLVCRRASFGLRRGPCYFDATGPDLAGARPDGATPEGVLDLAGNVAEWTSDPDGGYRARGGSFRSRVAAELVTGAVETAPFTATHVGFRCAYPRDP